MNARCPHCRGAIPAGVIECPHCLRPAPGTDEAAPDPPRRPATNWNKGASKAGVTLLVVVLVGLQLARILPRVLGGPDRFDWGEDQDVVCGEGASLDDARRLAADIDAMGFHPEGPQTISLEKGWKVAYCMQPGAWESAENQELLEWRIGPELRHRGWSPLEMRMADESLRTKWAVAIEKCLLIDGSSTIYYDPVLGEPRVRQVLDVLRQVEWLSDEGVSVWVRAHDRDHGATVDLMVQDGAWDDEALRTVASGAIAPALRAALGQPATVRLVDGHWAARWETHAP